MISVLYEDQFRDSARGMFRVRPRAAKRDGRPYFYHGYRVMRDASRNEFIIVKR